MGLAIAAEYRRNSSLYLSVGYTCGALAPSFFRPLYFLIAMVGGIAIVMVMRHGERR